MGLQEYLVTTRKKSIEDFVAEFGSNVVAVTLLKKDITDSERNLSVKKDEPLAVLYGDRHELADDLREKFPEENFWGSEFVNKAACGKLCPSQDEMRAAFTDMSVAEWLQNKTK